MQIRSGKVVEISKKNPTSSQIVGLGVFVFKEKIYLYFRSKEDPQDIFRVATSENGFSFTKQNRNVFIKDGEYTKINIKNCSNFSISPQDKYFNLIYLEKSGKKSYLKKAYSINLFSWEYEETLNFSDLEGGVIVPNYLLKNQLIMYLVGKTIKVAYSKDFINWEKNDKELINLKKYDDESKINNIGCVNNTENGLLMIYHSKDNYGYNARLVLFDNNDPGKVLWEVNEPIWRQPKDWGINIKPLGIILIKGKFIAYWQVEGKGIFAYVYALHKISDDHNSKDISIHLKRHTKNPIITPKNQNSWEAFNTFNPAAVYDEGKVHILYRAQGYDYISVIGYATSQDGININERFDKPIYTPFQHSMHMNRNKSSNISYRFISGGGYGGCEDPRITKIDNRYYLTYVYFDGINPPRVALTSISRENFLNRLWFWEKPILISPPGVVDKSAVIFPEKIKGKYVIMHRIYPNILIDFVDSLEFNGTKWLEGKYKIAPRPEMWDSRKIGAGAPPIKTKYGWLLIYQSVGERDPGRYKIGAMVLDINDPTKVLYRSQSPILEPETSYENDGFKSGVIYPCGAVVINDRLYVYYGGSDSYVCVATTKLEDFLNELKYSQITKLRNPVVEKIFYA